MKSIKKIISSCVATTFFMTTFTVIKYPVKAISMVKINPGVEYQTMDGWGTNLAWWAAEVGGWPDAKRKEIMDLVFSNDGLGLNILRYNIGGGENPSCTSGDNHMHPAREMDCFVPNDPGNGAWQWDWTQDANQIKILQEAVSNYNIDYKEANSNTPPWWMTVTQCASGSVNGTDNNLKSDYYDDFADFMTEVVKKFKNDFGVTFTSVTPLNEPVSGYWKKGGSQEGCQFKRPEQMDILKAVYNSLNTKGLLADTKLEAAEETSIDQTIDTLKSYDAETLGMLDRVSTHTYSGSKRSELKDVAASINKKLWMSEVSTGYAAHDDLGIAPAIPLGQTIMKDIKDMGASAWVIWQAVEDEHENFIGYSKDANSVYSFDDTKMWNPPGSWGLIHAAYTDFTLPADGAKYTVDGKTQFNTGDYTISKQYYVMGQFSKFIKKGYTIIDTNNDNVLAAVNKATGEVVIVATNFEASDVDQVFDLSSFNSIGATAEVYRTSDTEALTKLSDAAVTNSSLSASLPKNSVTTFVIKNSSYTKSISKIINDRVTGSGENQINYTGNWGSNDEVHWSNDSVNGGFSVKFTGNQIKLYGALSNDSGIAGVKIDGGEESLIDCYSAVRKDGVVVYQSLESLTEGEHTLTLRITGNKNSAATASYFVLDKVMVTSNYDPAEEANQKPSIINVYQKDSELRILFEGVEGADSYNIKYGTSTGNYTNTVPGVTTTDFNLTGLQNGTKYYVIVTAVSNGQESGNSVEVCGTPKAVTASDILYYVDCGDGSPITVEDGETLGMRNSKEDQPFSIDVGTGYSWGYLTDGGFWSNGGDDRFNSIITDTSDIAGKGFKYKFEIPNGDYKVMLAFKDPWNNSGRKHDIVIEGEVKETGFVPGSKESVKAYSSINVVDDMLEVYVKRSAGVTAGSADPILSWIRVEKAVPSLKPAAPYLKSVSPDKNIAAVSFIESTGAASYKLLYGTESENYTNEIALGEFEYSKVVSDLGSDRDYYFAVVAVNSLGESEKSNEVHVKTLGDVVFTIPHNQLTATATSQYNADYSADKALDGNPGTCWHSWGDWNSASITLDLGGTYKVTQLKYLPRSGDSGSQIGEYLIYSSMDAINYTQAAAGTFSTTDFNEKIALIENGVVARYIKLAAPAKGYISVAELNIVAVKELAKVTLNTDYDSIFTSGSAQLSINGTMNDNKAADLSNATVNYYTSNQDITISDKGVVTAVKGGSAEIYAEVNLDGKVVQSNIISITAAEPVVNSVQDLTAAVNHGENYILPEKVTVVMTDGSTKEVAVTWDKTADTAKDGVQTFTGTFANSEVKVTLTLTVNPIIAKVDNLEKTVNHGEVFVLPEKITAVMTDGTTKEVAVIWDKAADTTKDGIQIFNGTVPGYNGQVTFTLAVNTIIISIDDLHKTVSHRENFVLPVKVTVKMSDETTKEADVSWDRQADTNTPGVQVFKGTVPGNNGKVTLTLTVRAKDSNGRRDNDEDTVKNEIVVEEGNQIVVNDTDNMTVDQVVFETLKGKEKSITFEKKDSSGNVLVAWTFNGQA